MSVRIGPAMSIIVKRSSLKRTNLDITMLGEIYSSDVHMLVLGPLFDTQMASNELNKHGLTYFDDYFDLPHEGGPVPEWCQIVLEFKET
jgi:hypothetical protein